MPSAISGYLNSILNAVYGEQVRSAIVNAITQCYDDVTNPSLNTAAFSTAIEAAYADGFLDIQEKSTIAGMTNDKIIYRYTGNETGYVNGALYYYDGTKWSPIGSALQIASSAALMTDQGAIYKYTGSESGYINGALYYYNGTAFVPLMDKGSTDTAINNAKTDLIVSMTEAASGDGTNLINPDNLKQLGYHYDTSDGETHVTDTTYFVTENKINVGNNGVIFYLYLNSGTWFGQNSILCYDEDGDFLGIASVSTTTHLVVMKPETTYINIQFISLVPSNVCLADSYISEFKPYAVDISERVIKSSLLDTSALSADFLERVSNGGNLVDPSNLTAWGYYYSTYDGSKLANAQAEQFQNTKYPISAENNTEVYVRVRNTVSSLYTLSILCYDSSDTYLGYVSASLSTTDSQQKTLKSGTDHFILQINIYETTFNPSDLCVSFEELDAFEPFSYTLQIKSELLGGDALTKNSKKSTLYKKNAVIFGDSLIENNSALVDGIRIMTGLSTLYNAAVGGTSMSIRSATGTTYTKWWTMANIADCIATGNWTDTITALENDTETRAPEALAHANYLKELDFSEIDLFIIAHGANDGATDSDTAPYDTSTYGGAIRHVIDVLTTAYPNIKLVFCSVIYRTNGGATETQKCKQKLDILKGACNDFYIQYIDNLTELGINANNASYYLADGLHESTEGVALMRDHIVQCIW